MKTEIINGLKTAWAGKNCDCFESLDSTNDYAKKLADTETLHGKLIVADNQTAGKGRRGRVWSSEKGTTIAMSLCLEPELPTEKVSGLTLAAALATVRGIGDICGVVPEIKWPNDLVLNGKKICGILTEMIFKKDCYAVIVGIGVNVNNTEFAPQLQEIAGSLRLETGKTFSREKLIAAIVNHFEELYEIYLATEDFSLLREAYEQVLANKGREVRVLDPVMPFLGIAEGINDKGNLVVRLANGEQREIYSGEVSVRGMFGYV